MRTNEGEDDINIDGDGGKINTVMIAVIISVVAVIVIFILVVVLFKSGSPCKPKNEHVTMPMLETNKPPNMYS